MRLLTFSKGGAPTLGVRRGEAVVDLSVAAPNLPLTMLSFLSAGADALKRAAAAAASAPAAARVPLAGLTHLPPVPNPSKILCMGLNYRDHAAEVGLKIPEHPVYFTRFANSLTPHNGPLVRPRVSTQFDYEVELAVIIGRRARHLTRANALDAIVGYSIFNDGSLRDYQFRTPQWTPGKNFDQTGAFGPEIVTADELAPGGQGLRVQTRLNGKTLQDGNTRDLIFDVAACLVTLSEVMTLAPGDVIITGTPAGVGVSRKPQVFMKAGDVCELEIEGIGVLRNPIIDEPA